MFLNFAKALRGRMTPTEEILWRKLRAKRFHSWKFRRQVPLGPYIVDFCCFEARLVIEVDGSIHAEQREYDRIRDRYLQELGFRVLRFWNGSVRKNMSGVLEIISANLKAQRVPSPSMGEG